MAINNKIQNLIRTFVKNISTDKEQTTDTGTVYGTVVISDGVKQVRLDGGTEPTACLFNVEADEGDRVVCSVQNHSWSVDSNVTKPASSPTTVKGRSDVENIIDEKVISLSGIDVYYQKDEPTVPSGGFKDGDTWYQLDANGYAVALKVWRTNQWVSTQFDGGNIIRAHSITTSELAVDKLSAISADLGNITAGNIMGATISTTDGTQYVSLSNSQGLSATYGEIAGFMLADSSFRYNCDPTTLQPINTSIPLAYIGNRGFKYKMGNSLLEIYENSFLLETEYVDSFRNIAIKYSYSNEGFTSEWHRYNPDTTYNPPFTSKMSLDGLGLHFESTVNNEPDANIDIDANDCTITLQTHGNIDGDADWGQIVFKNDDEESGRIVGGVSGGGYYWEGYIISITSHCHFWKNVGIFGNLESRGYIESEYNGKNQLRLSRGDTGYFNINVNTDRVNLYSDRSFIQSQKPIYAPSFRVVEHSSNIGSMGRTSDTYDIEPRNAADGTWTYLTTNKTSSVAGRSIKLPAGTWLLVAEVSFAGSAYGRRGVDWENTTTGGIYGSSRSLITVPDTGRGGVYVQSTVIVSVDDDSLFRIRVFQDRGKGALAISYSAIQYLRIL